MLYIGYLKNIYCFIIVWLSFFANDIFITLHDFSDHAYVFLIVHSSSLSQLVSVSNFIYFDIVCNVNVIRSRILSFMYCV